MEWKFLLGRKLMGSNVYFFINGGHWFIFFLFINNFDKIRGMKLYRKGGEWNRKEKIIVVESIWNENFQRFPSEKIG